MFFKRTTILREKRERESKESVASDRERDGERWSAGWRGVGGGSKEFSKKKTQK
jgi:hypothetical protein